MQRMSFYYIRDNLNKVISELVFGLYYLIVNIYFILLVNLLHCISFNFSQFAKNYLRSIFNFIVFV